MMFDIKVHIEHLTKVFRQINEDAFILIGPVVAFDVAIAVGSLGGTNIGFDAQTGQKTDKGSRKAVTAGAGHEAGVPVEGNLTGTAKLLQDCGHRDNSRFGIELLMGWVIQQNGGAGVQDIQRFADSQGVTTAEIDAALAEAYAALEERDLASQYYQSAKRKAADGDPVNAARMRRIEELLAQDAPA